MELGSNRSSNMEANDFGEDDWVVVKRQRVYIHIPPLPSAEQSTINNHEPSHLHQEMPGLSHNHILGPPTFENRSADIVAKESNLLSRPRKHARSHGQMSSPKLAPALLLKPMNLEASKGNIGARPDDCRLKSSFVYPPRLPPICLDLKLRASNLERKLARAGGLNQWLASLGLEKFIKVFEGKNVGKFQLANLSMKKLKDMGAHAVGPRRKLMHALDCLCQPYCFEVV